MYLPSIIDGMHPYAINDKLYYTMVPAVMPYNLKVACCCSALQFLKLHLAKPTYSDCCCNALQLLNCLLLQYFAAVKGAFS